MIHFFSLKIIFASLSKNLYKGHETVSLICLDFIHKAINYEFCCCSTKCIHRLDKDSLTCMWARSNQAKCPWTGCQGIWEKDHVSLDEVFMDEMIRYQRVKERRLNCYVSQSQVHEIDNDYTDV